MKMRVILFFIFLAGCAEHSTLFSSENKQQKDVQAMEYVRSTLQPRFNDLAKELRDRNDPFGLRLLAIVEASVFESGELIMPNMEFEEGAPFASIILGAPPAYFSDFLQKQLKNQGLLQEGSAYGLALKMSDNSLVLQFRSSTMPDAKKNEDKRDIMHGTSWPKGMDGDVPPFSDRKQKKQEEDSDCIVAYEIACQDHKEKILRYYGKEGAEVYGDVVTKIRELNLWSVPEFRRKNGRFALVVDAVTRDALFGALQSTVGPRLKFNVCSPEKSGTQLILEFGQLMKRDESYALLPASTQEFDARQAALYAAYFATHPQSLITPSHMESSEAKKQKTFVGLIPQQSYIVPEGQVQFCSRTSKDQRLEVRDCFSTIAFGGGNEEYNLTFLAHIREVADVEAFGVQISERLAPLIEKIAEEDFKKDPIKCHLRGGSALSNQNYKKITHALYRWIQQQPAPLKVLSNNRQESNLGITLSARVGVPKIE